MKKLLSMILTVLMLISLLSVSSYAIDLPYAKYISFKDRGELAPDFARDCYYYTVSAADINKLGYPAVIVPDGVSYEISLINNEYKIAVKDEFETVVYTIKYKKKTDSYPNISDPYNGEGKPLGAYSGKDEVSKFSPKHAFINSVLKNEVDNSLVGIIDYIDDDSSDRYTLFKFDFSNYDIDFDSPVVLGCGIHFNDKTKEEISKLVGTKLALHGVSFENSTIGGPDWDETKACYNNTLGDGTLKIGDKVASDTIGNKSSNANADYCFYLLRFDITDYVKSEMKKGNKIISLLMKADEENEVWSWVEGAGSYASSLFMYPTIGSWNGTGVAALTLYFNIYKKDEDYIKDINPENGLLYPEFSEDNANYKILTDSLEGDFPKLNVVCGSDCKVKITYPADKTGEAVISAVNSLGEKIIRVKCELLNNELLSGKIKTDIMDYGNGYAADTYLGTLLKYRNELSDKKIYFYNAVLKGNAPALIYEDVKDTKLGEGVIYNTLYLPEDTNNIISFALSEDKELLNGASFLKNETDYEKNEDNIGLYQKDISKNNLTVSGRLIKSSPAIIAVLKKGDMFDLSLKDFADKCLYLELADTDSEGYYGKDIDMKWGTGDYVINVLNGKNLYQKEFYYASPEDKNQAIKNIFDSKSVEELKALLQLKDPMGNLNYGSDYVRILSLNISPLKDISEDSFINVFFGLIKEEKFDENNLNRINELYNQAVLIEQVNCNLISDITVKSDLVAIDEEIKKDFSSSSSEVREKIMKEISGKNFKKTDEISKAFKEAVIMSLFNYPENPSLIVSAIKKYSDYLSVNEENITKLNNLKSNNLSSFISDIIKGGEYKETESLSKKINSEIEYYYKKQQSEKPSGGGGGSGGGGRGNSYAPSNAGMDAISKLTQEEIDRVSGKALFTDLAGFEWAKDAINNLYKQKIISGTDEKTYAPGNSIKREEFVKMICFFAEDKEVVEKDFSDVNGKEWYAPFIKKAYKGNIISGISDSTFGVGMEITREDALVIIARIAQINNISTDNVEGDFADFDKVSDYAKSYVKQMKNLKIVNGDENNNFNPAGSLSRAEAAVIINNLLSVIKGGKQ